MRWPWPKTHDTGPRADPEKSREDLEAAQRDLEAIKAQRPRAVTLSARFHWFVKENHFAANTFALDPKRRTR